MRSFPSAARRRLAVCSVTGLLLVGLGASPQALTLVDHHGDKNLKSQQHHVQSQIGSASSDLDDSSRAFARATRKAAAARDKLAHARSHAAAVHRQLGEARTTADRLRDDLATSRQKLADANAALADAQQAVVDQRDVVRQQVVGTSTGTDPSLQALGSLFSPASSLQDLADDMTADSVVVTRTTSVFDDLKTTEADVADRQDAVEAATEAVADKTHAATAQLARVRTLYSQATQAKRYVSTLVTRSVKAKQRALAVRHHDRLVLQQLRTREHRIKQQILALAAREKGGYTGSSGGFLSNPAQGYPVTSPFGYRINPIYGYYGLHNGIDYGVPCGTPLTAAADGTVINEYTDQVYGNRLYLNVGRVNGHNITVVYNHLTRWVATTGEHVKRGQLVTISGTTGWSTGCHLHFTVLQDGVPVNPVPYL